MERCTRGKTIIVSAQLSPSSAGTIAETLSDGVSGRAETVLIGLNWTLVVGPLGVGLSHSPVRGTSGCSGLPAPGSYAGQKLAELAKLTKSDNVFENAIGYAAINAHHNRFDITGSEKNGLDMVEDHGERTVVVGQFPGLAKRLPNAAIIERDPRPGCYPEEAAETLLPNAKQVIITASAISNGSIAPLLNLSKNAFVIIVGPSAPLSTKLFDFNVNAVSGYIAINTDALIHTAMEGGAVSAMRPHGRFLTLMR